MPPAHLHVGDDGILLDARLALVSQRIKLKPDVLLFGSWVAFQGPRIEDDHVARQSVIFQTTPEYGDFLAVQGSHSSASSGCESLFRSQDQPPAANYWLLRCVKLFDRMQMLVLIVQATEDVDSVGAKSATGMALPRLDHVG